MHERVGEQICPGIGSGLGARGSGVDFDAFGTQLAYQSASVPLWCRYEWLRADSAGFHATDRVDRVSNWKGIIAGADADADAPGLSDNIKMQYARPGTFRIFIQVGLGKKKEIRRWKCSLKIVEFPGGVKCLLWTFTTSRVVIARIDASEKRRAFNLRRA